MKKILTVAIAAILVAVVITVVLIQNARSRSPEVLLKKLAAGQGNKEELIMRLNVARGDVVGPMIEAVQNEKVSPQFRAEVLELLFKKNFNSGEPRIEEVLVQAASDPDVIIRRKAAEGLAVYAEPSLQLALIDHICGPDPEVRRRAQMLLLLRERYAWRVVAAVMFCSTRTISRWKRPRNSKRKWPRAALASMIF